MTWYSNGTVTVTNGQRLVTGVGTDFVSNVLAGQGFLGPDARTYELEQVVSATQLLLRKPYLGGTAGAQDYAILPTQSLMKDLADQAGALIASFATVRDGAGQGLFPDGTAAGPAIRFSADQDTGLYRKGPNTIAIAGGGADKLELGAVATLFANPEALSALDLVGRAQDGVCRLRILNPTRTGAPAYFGITENASVIIASELGNCLYAAAGNTSHHFSIGAARVASIDGGALYPSADNVLAMGGINNRWSVIYSSTGAIQTSDERLKANVRGLSTAELAAAKDIAAQIRVFQFHDAIAEKGEAARLHVGVMAQQVGDILAAHGLDPERYAFWCHDSWAAAPAAAGVPAQPARDAVLDAEGNVITPAQPASAAVPGSPAVAAGDRYSIRYDELAMFIAAAQEQRLAALEAAVAAQGEV